MNMSPAKPVEVSTGTKTFVGGQTVVYAPENAGWMLKCCISHRQDDSSDFVNITPPPGEGKIMQSTDGGQTWQPCDDSARGLWRDHCEASMTPL